MFEDSRSDTVDMAEDCLSQLEMIPAPGEMHKWTYVPHGLFRGEELGFNPAFYVNPRLTHGLIFGRDIGRNTILRENTDWHCESWGVDYSGED